MFRLLLTIFLVSTGVFIYSYFRELNPGMVLVRTSPTVEIELSPVTLVLISMAIGAVVVTFVVGLQQTAHAIINWQSSRLVRRKELSRMRLKRQHRWHHLADRRELSQAREQHRVPTMHAIEITDGKHDRMWHRNGMTAENAHGKGNIETRDYTLAYNTHRCPS